MTKQNLISQVMDEW